MTEVNNVKRPNRHMHVKCHPCEAPRQTESGVRQKSTLLPFADGTLLGNAICDRDCDIHRIIITCPHFTWIKT